MWQSADYPNHGYDFHNNDNDPMDGHGHGTHCAGTVAGDGTAGSQTGMAPDASLMGCKVLGDDGSGEESSVWAAIEFSVDQGAHILSMSLGWQHAWNPDRPTWRTTLDNTLAAGVVASIAAGNEGGSTTNVDDVRTPGDCPPPWLHPDQTLIGGISAVVCVGATDASDNIASFSSRGPSEWESISPFNDYPYNPEIGLLRPDVSAPGVDIKSCNAFNVNGYTNMSGTSMATPGVAGVMALLMSKNMGLSPEDICMILETTSVELGASGKDNVFGTGRVDAFQAVENTSEAGPSYESHAFNDPNGNGEIEASESILMSLTMYNGSDLEYPNVDVTITCESPYITMTDSEENYGVFPIGTSIEKVDAYSFTVSEDLPGLEDIRFNVSATDGVEVWTSSFNVVSFGPKLSIGIMDIDDSNGNDNGRLDPGETADLIFSLHNFGQVDLNTVMVNLNNSGSYLTFENIEYTIDALASENVAHATFTVSVSESAPEGVTEIINLEAASGVYSDLKEFSLVLGIIVEDWETGGFDQFNWTFGNTDWVISDVDPYEGVYCSQSGNIGDSQMSSMILSYEVGSAGTISFYKKVSSESGYDFLKFYIDDQEQNAWSGEVDWSMEEFEVTAGAHIFKWTYSKDVNTTGGDDAAYLDWIVLPPIALPSIQLETDVIICEGETYQSDAEVENYNSLEWTTTGDGSFDDATIAAAVYTPGTNDISSKVVMLTLTAFGGNGNISSTVNLTIQSSELNAPNSPVGETNLCLGSGSQTYFSSYDLEEELVWQIEPIDAGVLTSAGDSAVIVWDESFYGEVSLIAKLMNTCTESEFSEPTIIQVHNNPYLNVNSSFSACVGTEVEIPLDLSGEAPWSIGVIGSDDIIASENPFILSWNVNQDSTVEFNSLTDANGCTLEDYYISFMVFVLDAPVVNIGNDTSVCMNHVITLDAANNGASYVWSNNETSQTIMVDSAGMNDDNEKMISVTVSNDNCSIEDEILISFEDCSGIEELLSISNFNVYPNPNHGKFEIELNSMKNQEVQLEVYDLLGARVYSEVLSIPIGSYLKSIDLSTYPSQTYLLSLKTSESKIVQRVIIE